MDLFYPSAGTVFSKEGVFQPQAVTLRTGLLVKWRYFNSYPRRDYNPAVVKHINTKPALRPFKGVGQMREHGLDSDWFPVEFLIYYDDHDKLRTFAYVRKEDGSEVPDGEYDVVDDLVNTAADGRSGKAGGRCNGGTDGAINLNCCNQAIVLRTRRECYGDVSTASGSTARYSAIQPVIGFRPFLVALTPEGKRACTG